MSKLLFEDLLIKKDGLIKGPFGGDIKKSLFVEPSEETYKVYEQGIVLKNNLNIGNYYVSKEHFESKLKRFEVKEGDILMTGAGTLGELFTIPSNHPKGIINQALLRIRLNEKIVTSSFFKYYFKYYIKAIINRLNSDSVIPNLPPLQVIKNTEVYLPNLPTQIRIAHILSTLDAKIENNNRINAQLEAMAKTIYDYWFVQFDFPDANGKPYKSNGGKMVWNEELKRSVPEGWEVGTLSDIANITMGQSPPGESYNEERIGTVFYQGCTDFGTRYPSVRKYTDSPTRFAKQGDILLSVRAPVGTMNIANENCCIGRGLAALNSKNNSISFLYGAMNNLKQIFDRRNNDGTTFGSITKDDLFSLQVIIPPTEIVNQFDKKLYTSFEKQNNIEQQNQQLSSLRDWLLPMLMNGQVSVGE
jgi:type I restriction enzyme S subunit